MDYLCSIWEYIRLSLLFLFGEATTDHLQLPYLVFLIATSLVGLLCVLLDFAYYKTTQKSLFNLSYIGFLATVWVFLFWGVGSGIVGFIALRLGLVAFTIQSSIVIGLGWPLLFPKIYEYAKTKVDEVEPVEMHSMEVEEEPEEDLEEDTEEEEPGKDNTGN